MNDGDEKIVRLRAVEKDPVPKEPHQGVIEVLERLLQEARAGEIVGVAAVFHDENLRSGYVVVGFVGGFSLVGAAQCVLQELTDINRGFEPGDD
jgi:hypothetical protein